MKELSDQLYHSMLQDCEQCRKKQLYIIEEVECCFHICTRYWGVLRERLARYEFSSATDEIYFFKNIKPLFTSEIEYYKYVSFAELTRDKEHDPCELKRFWNSELQRLAKFIKYNIEFYEYYKKGRTDSDEIFFTRKNSALTNFPRVQSYQTENITMTSHDYLVASILALEKYQCYLKTKEAFYFNK